MPIIKNKKPTRRKSALILILFIFLFSKFVTSQSEYEYTINSYLLYFDIVDELKVKETIEVIISPNAPLSRYTFYSEYSIENPEAIIEINGKTQIANVSVSKIVGEINAIYIEFPEVSPGDQLKIRISFYSEGMLQTINGKKQFSYYVKFNQPVGYFYARLYIPKGYAILSPIVPSPDKVESSGNALVLEWKKQEVRPGEEFYFITGFSGEVSNEFPLLYFVVPVLIAFVGGFLAGILYKGKEKSTVDLRSDEEKVIGILREGPMYQSELVKRLGFSKAKVSLLLKDMEKKGLIERIKEGRTYLVKLKEM
ncbi:MarR family transcriptional regulator [Thermococcus argininiproducens]|uniref:MarR family transcriptional regulator n=1 Tax=Thermococcus argininiproducens TaxID=2866384 RepID=A0A9E7SCL7_9EURY|nr:MarR family transcriptional regulator [Thermococcus argininiproducens]USG99561.1 MarR family transcriptional regulator [Thermococcus argininiproducens]